MHITTRRVVSIVIFALTYGLIVGCVDEGSSSSILTTGVVSDRENSLDKPVDAQTINNSSKEIANLESWIGSFVFTEYAPPDQNMFYSLSISKEGTDYYATISIDGFQTLVRLRGKVVGDANWIQVRFDQYLPDNQFETYEIGDQLLRLDKKNAEIYTTWGKLQPMLEDNTKSDRVYFQMER